MGETNDPRKALGAKDVRTRAAAARDLAREGTWEDLEVLVGMALGEKSSAVRLYTAGAAADIAARERRLAGPEGLSAVRREQLHAWVRPMDPGANPSLLMLLTAAGDGAALDKLGRILRDPRNGVRMGALAALRRLALSAASQGLDALPERVEGWLAHPKAPPDVILDLVHLVGEAGWTRCRSALARSASAGRPHGAAVEQALERLSLREQPETWEGLWASRGLDVLEVSPEGPLGWVLVHQGRVWSEGKRPDLEGARLVWAPVLGEAPEIRRLALQEGGHTWWRLEAMALVKQVDELVEALPHELAPLGALAGSLQEVEGVVSQRAQAILRWRGGDLAGAIELLESLTLRSKPRADLYWWLGRARLDDGQTEAGLASLQTFLERAGKRARYRAEAQALVDGATR